MELDNPATTGLTKKKSLPFDRRNFIHIRKTSIYEDYEFNQKLGEGAYGSVYRATNIKTNLTRAVKTIHKSRIKNIEFLNELSVLKTVDHPNVIKLFDCYLDNDFYYLVEEYCSGGNLYDYIKKEKYFNEQKAANIMYQLFSALNHLHSKKIVHRDLKPENITFFKTDNTNDIFIKLIDFGTSVSIKGEEKLTQELGTIYYIAPDVFMNNYNEKADIWSCGIILYTMLCGHPPFRGNKEEDIKAKILKGMIDFPEREWKLVSKEAINFLKKLLEYNQINRLTAREALESKWINDYLQSNHNDMITLNVVENLTKFSSSITLQKATLSYLSLQLGQNEEIKKIQSEFNKIDKNKDGVLSKEELLECFSKIYPKQEAKMKVKEMLTEIDFNNDGTINFSEFVAVNMKKERICQSETLKKAFDLFDLDGNGYITIEELKETIPIELSEDVSWDDVIKEVDIDGDNQISFEEFKMMMEKISTHM